MVRFNHKKLKEIERKEVEVSDRLVALEHLKAEAEIHSAWKIIREYIRTSSKEIIVYYELKKHKTWFDEGPSELFYGR
jgi:hypothetical protein